MKFFGISMEVDHEAYRNSRAVSTFGFQLSDALDQDYGADLQYFTVGLICMRSRPGYEAWYKERKPRYRKREVLRLPGDTREELANTFSYDIRLTDAEYERFVSGSSRAAVELVAARLSESLRNLDKLPSLVKDFDRVRFEADFARASAAALGRVAP